MTYVHVDWRLSIVAAGDADILPHASQQAGLGFSDQSSFTRAAHRWFDASPSKVRAEMLARRKGN